MSSLSFQVGVVASKYIELNKDWSRPRYLNIMNNLLCGVPMIFMRRLPVSTYLQLSHQVNKRKSSEKYSESKLN